MRKLLIALLLLVPAMSASAFRFDFDNRVLIGSGNEKLTMGINKNDDDFLIFNYTFAFFNGPFGFQSYLNAFTDRASNQRHDELIVSASWTFTPYDSDRVRFSKSEKQENYGNESKQHSTFHTTHLPLPHFFILIPLQTPLQGTSKKWQEL